MLSRWFLVFYRLLKSDYILLPGVREELGSPQSRNKQQNVLHHLRIKLVPALGKAEWWTYRDFLTSWVKILQSLHVIWVLRVKLGSEGQEGLSWRMWGCGRYMWVLSEFHLPNTSPLDTWWHHRGLPSAEIQPWRNRLSWMSRRGEDV